RAGARRDRAQVPRAPRCAPLELTGRAGHALVREIQDDRVGRARDTGALVERVRALARPYDDLLDATPTSPCHHLPQDPRAESSVAELRFDEHVREVPDR